MGLLLTHRMGKVSQFVSVKNARSILEENLTDTY
jgi:hypothetical protein